MYKNLIYEFKNKSYKPNRIHIDFEKALSNALINIWSNSNINSCLFHYDNFIERKEKYILIFIRSKRIF